MSYEHTPEVWAECKKPCVDCPLSTADRARACRHIWRQIIDLSKNPDGTIADTAIIHAWKNGATVSDLSVINGLRPSIQIFDFQPVEREGYTQVHVIPSASNSEEGMPISDLLSMYDLIESSPLDIPTSLIEKLRAGILKIGINHSDEYAIQTATSGSIEELMELFQTILEDYERSVDL